MTANHYTGARPFPPGMNEDAMDTDVSGHSRNLRRIVLILEE